MRSTSALGEDAGVARALASVAAAVLVLSAVACGSSAPKTSTLIVLGRRIGPIYLGESRAKIEAAYGKGKKMPVGRGRPAPPVFTVYPAVSIGVIYYGKGAVFVETTSLRYHTASGIGVGSGIPPVRKLGANCTVTPGQCGLAGGFGPPKHPTTATTFFLNQEPFPNDHGTTRVVEIVVAPLMG